MAEQKKPAAPKAEEAAPLKGQGEITNTQNGTIQREATPEELPADAKIAPVLEQVAPNQTSLAVGALKTPAEIGGIEQPEEGRKVVESDQSDATAFLAPSSEQTDKAERAQKQAEIDADEGKA